MTSLASVDLLMLVLVQAEGKQPPSATEMEMKTRLVNMEVEMTAVSTKHQDE